MQSSIHMQGKRCGFAPAPAAAKARAVPAFAATKKQLRTKSDAEESSLATRVCLGFAASTFTLLSTLSGPVSAQEVASIAADSALDDATEAVRTLIPNPLGLFDKEKAAQNAEAQEKRAVDAPQTSFRAASPVGGQGEVSKLADQGIKGGAGFDAAASKLTSADSAKQYEGNTVVDKYLQKDKDYEKSAQFKANAPGSGAGNSVIGRTEKQISGN